MQLADEMRSHAFQHQNKFSDFKVAMDTAKPDRSTHLRSLSQVTHGVTEKSR